MGLPLYWECKPTDAIHAGVYTSDKSSSLSTIDKIHLKYDCINGSIINGFQQPTVYSVVLNKLPDFEVFCELETLQYKNNIQICFEFCNIFFEDDDQERDKFNVETLNFTLQMIGIWTIKWFFKNLKPVPIVLDRNTTPVQKLLLVDNI